MADEETKNADASPETDSTEPGNPDETPTAEETSPEPEAEAPAPQQDVAEPKAEEPVAAPPVAPPPETAPAKPKPKPKPKAKEPEVPSPLQRALLKSSPHKAGTDSVPRIMYTVVVALVPACVAAVWFFGIKALAILVGATVACVAIECAFLAIRMPLKEAARTALDGSAIITGLLLALNLPSSSPWWLVLIGALVAIGLGKQTFGGLGQNPFNPALVARVFLLLSFPAHMTTWEIPVDRFLQLDSVTAATPLGILAESGTAGLEASGVQWFGLFIGNVGGSRGEVSVLALLIGAAYMLIRRVITWHIPVSYLGMMLLFTGLCWLIDPEQFASPTFHLISGGLILGAFFMATDMVTSPVTPRGMLIFGAGCGLITAAIRLFGAFPEGVSFAILVMNGFVPLIERRTKPRKFGEVKERKGAAAHA